MPSLAIRPESALEALQYVSERRVWNDGLVTLPPKSLLFPLIQIPLIQQR